MTSETRNAGMSEYTPTTEQVRDAYGWGEEACGCCVIDPEKHIPEFDRWYEAEKRKWQAEGLREFTTMLEELDSARNAVVWIVDPRSSNGRGGAYYDVADLIRHRADQIEKGTKK